MAFWFGPKLTRLLGVLLLLNSAPVAFAQSSDAAWLEELTLQLASEKQCRVEYFVNLKETELASRKTYVARAQCRDGRQFDASRIEPAEKFIIKTCGTAVC
jgi:hypothetical protein